MKKLTAILSAAAILALPAVALTSEGEPVPPQQKRAAKVVAEVTVAENATVQAVDMKRRSLTLLLSDGRKETFLVDKSVRKLEQVKVGDTVKARYREAVTVKINKVKVDPEVKVEASVSPDQKSVKPAGAATMRVTTTATIDRIFDGGRKVTLRMPDDTTSDVEVRDPENQAKIKNGEVKEGDQIEITYHRAVAISVEKGAQK